jgi:uncharacterized protein YabN with tetrapyrrole methylase and pyrophosphatase domain
MITNLKIPADGNPRGSIACVGLGMTLGSHLTPLARSYIEQADVVFAGVSNGVVEKWLQRMHKDVRSLQPYYGEGKPRSETYREWVDLMMTEVRADKKVCGVFYGHPGVFAWSPHKVVEVARAEGFEARMEPGISAEDCLYADLGIDPGTHGCQHFEVNQFVFFKRRVDPTACLVLWQVAMLANSSISMVGAAGAYQQLLVDRLSQDYPLDQEVIIYRAATLPIEGPQIRRIALKDIPTTPMTPEETLVIRPAKALERDEEFISRVEALDKIHRPKAMA